MNIKKVLKYLTAWLPTPLSAIQTNSPACSLPTLGIFRLEPCWNLEPDGSFDFSYQRIF